MRTHTPVHTRPSTHARAQAGAPAQASIEATLAQLVADGLDVVRLKVRQTHTRARERTHTHTHTHTHKHTHTGTHVHTHARTRTLTRAHAPTPALPQGGDPAVFGRLGSELAALRAAGVGEVHVVPGVSALSAAPLAAGFPLTAAAADIAR